MIEERVNVAGKRVRYIEAGAGVPVVFAAGLGISADFYKPNIAALAAAGCRAIAPDMPGSGKTRGRFLGGSIPQLADDLIAFANAKDVRHAIWIGHSVGCQAALHVAARRPDLVRGIVLSGPTGGYGHRLSHQAGALAVAAVSEPWRLLKAVLRDYVRLSPFNYLGTWVKAARDNPLVVAAQVRCPVLILVGTKDRVPQPDFISQLAAKLGDAHVVKLAGGQHGLPLDAQTHFDNAVISFIRELAG